MEFEEKIKLFDDRMCYLPRPTRMIRILDWLGHRNTKGVVEDVGLDSWHACIEFGYWVGDDK